MAVLLAPALAHAQPQPELMPLSAPPTLETEPQVPSPPPSPPQPVAPEPVQRSEPRDTSRVQLSLSGVIGSALLRPGPNPPVSFSNIGGGAGLRCSIFFRRLVDDDSPLSLQPFLQRQSSVSIWVGGGGFLSEYSANGRELSKRRVGQGSVRLSVDAYATRFLNLGAMLGVSHSTLTDTDATDPFFSLTSTSLSIPAAIWLGFRVKDTLIDVTYGITPQRSDAGSFTVPFWGGVDLSVRTVLQRRMYLYAGVGVLNRGAAVAASFSYYFSKQVSLYVGLNYAYGVLYSSETTGRHRAGGDIGAVYWFSRRVGAELGFSPQWTGGTAPGKTETIDLTGAQSFFLRL